MNESLGKTQIEKFKQAARELECDDDDQKFKERLGAIAGKTAPSDQTVSKRPETRKNRANS